jgi:hypothetical protein
MLSRGNYPFGALQARGYRPLAIQKRALKAIFKSSSPFVKEEL